MFRAALPGGGPGLHKTWHNRDGSLRSEGSSPRVGGHLPPEGSPVPGKCDTRPIPGCCLSYENSLAEDISDECRLPEWAVDQPFLIHHNRHHYHILRESRFPGAVADVQLDLPRAVVNGHEDVQIRVLRRRAARTGTENPDLTRDDFPLDQLLEPTRYVQVFRPHKNIPR